MSKSKKSGKKPAVKVADLSAKSDPKGGAYNSYVAIKGTKQGPGTK